MIQTIKIDAMAYLYDDCVQYMGSFYNKLSDAINNNKRFRFINLEMTNDGIHLFSEIENQIDWEVDDYGCESGSGHYNGLLNRKEYIYYLKNFIKSVDTDNVYCELDDNSDFGDY